MTPANSNLTAASNSTAALTSVSNSSKRTRDDTEAENDEILPMENDSDQQISKTPRYSWTPEEDNIVIHCYNENPNNYVDEAQKKLPHRTARAIKDRFYKYLKKCVDDVKISKTPSCSWTPEEDNTLIHCYNKNPNNYVDEAQKKLPHRNAQAIRDRFNKYLTKCDDVNLHKRKKY
jgi:hypothetical protein